MRFRIALGKWEQADGDMPTVVTCCNEYDEDAWGGQTPDWYDEAITTHYKENGDVREVYLTVPDEAILRLFAIPTLDAAVEACRSMENGTPMRCSLSEGHQGEHVYG